MIAKNVQQEILISPFRGKHCMFISWICEHFISKVYMCISANCFWKLSVSSPIVLFSDNKFVVKLMHLGLIIVYSSDSIVDNFPTLISFNWDTQFLGALNLSSSKSHWLFHRTQVKIFQILTNDNYVKLMMLDNYKVNTIFQTFITPPWNVSLTIFVLKIFLQSIFWFE